MWGARRGMWGIGLLLFTGCATVELREPRAVSGRVTDATGQPVAGSPVILIGRRLELSVPGMAYVERGRREVRGVTDADGRYRFEFDPAMLGNDFTLFFHGEQTFDRVRFAQPAPLNITDRLVNLREVVVSVVLHFHPGWPEVQRQMAYYGPESDRGKILRRHGLPQKRESSPAGEGSLEIWWYPEHGVSYSFDGDRLVRTHDFPPVRDRR
ncbi:MAG: carboxypeptidase regulatory-like domain-containing protein [candidate division NC10 bacterium]|nr:carboxypeptidase regulatory-like domain-containing protein [candidate division NC10 bacterium]